MNALRSEQAVIFDKILPAASFLMADAHGNHVIQKFFEYGSRVQKLALIRQMRGLVVSLAIHMHGHRVLRKALVSVTADMKVSSTTPVHSVTLRDMAAGRVTSFC